MVSLLLNRAHTLQPLQCVHDWAIAHSQAAACFYLVLHQNLKDSQIQSTRSSLPKGKQLRKPANLLHIEAVCQAFLTGGPWKHRACVIQNKRGSDSCGEGLEEGAPSHGAEGAQS